MVFDRFGLTQPHNKCISKAATCHGNSTVQAASNKLRRSRCIQIFPLTYNLYRERDCCTIHIVKKGYRDVLSSHDCIFHVEQVPTDRHFLFFVCGVNMVPPWPLPLRHRHSCLYTRSVFERKKMNSDTAVVIHACTRGLFFFFFFFFASVRPGHAHDT